MLICNGIDKQKPFLIILNKPISIGFSLELTMGIEPMTSPLPRECSTPEPRKQSTMKCVF
jgi:hypothetical protein